MNSRVAEVGVIGGSGFYHLVEGASEVAVHTPYGAPSGPVAIGSFAGRQVAFVARHGQGHTIPPHRVNYRANLWALRELGVKRVLAPAAAGSLAPAIEPGDLVVLDQLVDRTWGRPDTFVDGPVVDHVSFADPYCLELSDLLVSAGHLVSGTRVHPAGTVVVIQGPRFSTRAESRWFRAMGWDVVNMTQYPEAYLARELGLCYAGIALVTDYDTGREGDEPSEPVTMAAAMEVLGEVVDKARSLLEAVLPSLPTEPGCTCSGSAARPLRPAAREQPAEEGHSGTLRA